jgi:hypothetical protein
LCSSSSHLEALLKLNQRPHSEKMRNMILAGLRAMSIAAAYGVAGAGTQSFANLLVGMVMSRGLSPPCLPPCPESMVVPRIISRRAVRALASAYQWVCRGDPICSRLPVTSISDGLVRRTQSDTTMLVRYQ